MIDWPPAAPRSDSPAGAASATIVSPRADQVDIGLFIALLADPCHVGSAHLRRELAKFYRVNYAVDTKFTVRYIVSLNESRGNAAPRRAPRATPSTPPRRRSSCSASFSFREPRLSLADLATRTGIPRATAFRLLSTLEQVGFPRQGPRRIPARASSASCSATSSPADSTCARRRDRTWSRCAR